MLASRQPQEHPPLQDVRTGTAPGHAQ